MRFFVAVCVFGLLIGSAGWFTNNWSASFFNKPTFRQHVVNDSGSHFARIDGQETRTLVDLPITSPVSSGFPDQLASEMSGWK